MREMKGDKTIMESNKNTNGNKVISPEIEQVNDGVELKKITLNDGFGNEVLIQDVLRDGVNRLDSFTYKGDEVERFAIQIRTVINNLIVCANKLDENFVKKEIETKEKIEEGKDDAESNAE